MTEREILESPDRRIKFVIGDARRMEEVEDGSVNLTMTSCPYGIGLAYGVPGDNPGYGGDWYSGTPGQVEMPVLSMEDYGKYLKRLEEVWVEVDRKTAPGGFVAINVAPIHTKAEFFGFSFMLPVPDDIAHFFRFDLGYVYRWLHIWPAMRTRTNSNGAPTSYLGSYGLKDPETGETYGIPLKGQVLREIEEVIILQKPPAGDKAPMSEEREERRRRSRISFTDWKKTFAQVWDDIRGTPGETVNDTSHPAIFDEEIPRRIIRGYSCIDDLVLDPFAGTGTTAIPCRELGRRFVGYEIEKTYIPHIEKKTQLHTPSLEDVW
jgi:DNA modification methylase